MTKLKPAHHHWYPLYQLSSLILFAVLMLFGEEGRGQVLIDETLRSGSLPTGWSQTDVTFTTAASGYARLTSINSALTTPAFNASAYSSIEVNLSVAKFGSGGDGPITVEYSLNGGDTWVVAGNSLTPTSTTHLNNTIEVASSSSNMVVRFTRGDSPSEKRLRDIVITGIGTTSGPTISLTGNSQPINNGSNTPSPTNHTDFGTVDINSGTQLRIFTITNEGAVDLELTGSPNVTISGTHASDFTVTEQPASSIIAPTNSTTFQINFDPSALGLREATVTIPNNDTEFTFAISGNGTNSNLSDIIEDNTYTYSSNIDYTQRQGNPITNTTQSIGVFKFLVRDGGLDANDADALPTELNSITFFVFNIGNIRSAALFGGGTQGTMLNNTPTINYGSGIISFSGLGGADFTAGDNDEVAITLRISFQTNVTDNQQLQFTILEATANPAGSTFAQTNAGGATSSTTSDRNRIEVIADRLGFVQQPSNTTVLTAMTPAVTIQGEDIFGNRDLDFTGSISLSSLGSMTGEPISANAIAGLATFSGLEHSVADDDLELTASSMGLTFNTTNSITFDIIEFLFLAGDVRPLNNSYDLSWAGSDPYYWEEFNGSSWESRSASPQGTKPSRLIIDKSGILAGGNTSNTYNDIIILSGGELILNDDGNPTVPFIGANKKLEIESGGSVILNGQIDFASTSDFIIRSGGTFTLHNNAIGNAHDFWAGNENFEPGSDFIILDHLNDGSGTSSLINIYGTVADNSQGAKFGDLIIDISVDNTWVLVGGNTDLTLCENLIITNSGSSPLVMFSNTNTPSAIITRNLIHNSGTLGLTSTFSGTSTSQTLTIEGNLVTNSGVLKLFHSGGGNAGGINVNLKGDLSIAPGVTVTNDGTPANSSFNFTGNGLQSVNVAPQINSWRFFAKNGSNILLTVNDLQFNGNCAITIESGAGLNFGFNGSTALNIRQIGGSNSFSSQQASTLIISSPDGLSASTGSTGNIQNIAASNRSISQIATFHYVGKQNQVTGDALSTGSTGKILIVELENDTDFLTLTNGIGISDGTQLDPLGGRLEIRSGTLVSSAANPINGSGRLVMSGGTYQIAELTTAPQYVPQLTGPYQLTGGTIELNGGPGTQTLRGGRNYHSLIFSGGGTKNTSSAISNISGTVTIKDDNTVLDVVSSTFSGSADLEMSDNSRFRMSAKGVPLPQLTGDYNLSGGTIEWYGTSSSQTHSIRGGKTYFNIDINALELNDEFDAANVVVGSGFQVNGTMNVNSPASLKIGSLYSITGSSGIVSINADATLKYGSEDGINLNGETGNIRTNGRVFSSSAGYALIGSVDQVTGTGLPATVSRLNVEKTNQENVVTLTADVEVSERIFMRRGILVNSDHELIVGSSPELSGNLIYEEGAIRGKITRWVPASTGTFLFPVGKTTYNPAIVEFTSNTNGGTLTAEFIEEIPAGYFGILPPTTDGINFNNLSEKGFWRINAGNGLSSGTYTLSLDASDFPGVDVPENIRILKSPSESYTWSIDGVFVSFTDDTIIHSGMSGFSDFTLGGDSNENPLPIELLHFTASSNDSEVLLSWATASEINNDFFTLERSADMRSVEIIGHVQGAGNSNQTLTYQFTDPHPLTGINYYRLKQTDFDGSYEYSDWTAVSSGTEKYNSLKIVNILYRQNQATVWARVQPGEFLQMRVFDLFGREVYRNEFVPEDSFFEHTFTTRQKGLYIIRLTDTYTFQTRKFGNL